MIRMSTMGNSVYFSTPGYCWHDSGKEARKSVGRLLRDEQISKSAAKIMLAAIRRKENGGPGEEVSC